MGERLIEKLDRLGAEAGIQGMTPEIRRFALLVRADMVAQPEQRPWVGLTDKDIYAVLGKLQDMYNRPPTEDSRIIFAQAIEAKLKEKNFD